ncbi:MAG: CotH kinase family protein [Acholeplasmatales bacterium]|nr:CotH kinase family protein [Acholeplasmatales bacterium]
MKKLLLTFASLGLCLGVAACSKKQSKSTTKGNNSSTTNKTSQTTKRNTTSNKVTTADYQTDNPNYVSDFEPVVSASLPKIEINVTDENPFKFYDDVETVDSPKEYANCTVKTTEGETVELDGVTAQVKVRGNYTVEYDKKPLRIKFTDKQSMLGLHGGKKYKNWVLLAEYKDWSMLRNATAFYLGHLMDGNYVSDFRLVNVYLNDEYYGVYLLAEQQEVKGGRIDITEPDKNYEGTDIGYFIELDKYYNKEDALQQFLIDYKTLYNDEGKAISNYPEQKGYTIKSDVYSDTQTNFIKNYIQNVFEICYQAIYNNKFYEFDSTYSTIKESTTLKSQTETISKIIDIDSLVNSYLLADIACDVDVATSSFFMNVDFGAEGDKVIRFESPWDFDSSFGNTLGCLDGKGVYAGNIIKNVHGTEVANPWYLLFYHANWFKTLVKDKYNGMKANGSFTKVINFINTTTENFATDFTNNYKEWKNIGHPEYYWIELETSDAGKCRTHQEASECLVTWLTNRLDNLDKLYNNK